MEENYNNDTIAEILYNLNQNIGRIADGIEKLNGNVRNLTEQVWELRKKDLPTLLH